MISKKIKIKGIVQGVGFRPFVWKLAKKFNLSGSIQNRSDGVLIFVEGTELDIITFTDKLKSDKPPLAIISSIEIINEKLKNFNEFTILTSKQSSEIKTRVSPDITICEDCRNELFEKNNKRYRYPFTNCVNCGPRFSIIDKIPYDRVNTSMDSFTMCPSCYTEYHDPLDRRYHAQPIACPECGPQILVYNKTGNEVEGNWEDLWIESIDAGLIVAIKGIGGFHLACDALNLKVLKTLRKRKNRENKPFAIMTNDLQWIKKHCYVSNYEEKLLISKNSPIVILKKRKTLKGSEYIAPGLNSIGIMMPYTPMHLLMMDRIKKPIILTSANYSNEPIICDNNVALNSLNSLADLFIIHNRNIVNRCDDSVTVSHGDLTSIIRPGRGFSPFHLSSKSKKTGVAFGSDLKNTFSIHYNNSIIVSPYNGNLEHPETQQIFKDSINRYMEFYNINPSFIVHDMHPDFFSTNLAIEYSKKLKIPAISVQHHHAHLAAGYAEHHIEGKAIGFAFDGTGYGSDDTIWGGEVFIFDDIEYSRKYHFKKVSLPGGDLAIREPARIAISLLNNCSDIKSIIGPLCHKDYIQKIQMQLKAGINCPITSSIARLFDVVSYLLGLCSIQTYDGEAAMKLEAVADKREKRSLPFLIKDGIIDCFSILNEIDKLQKDGIKVETISGRFHNMIIEIIFYCIREISKSVGNLPVIFSGGVFQNRLLVEKILLHKENTANKLYFSSLPNDSGISIGQAVVGTSLSNL